MKATGAIGYTPGLAKAFLSTIVRQQRDIESMLERVRIDESWSDKVPSSPTAQ